MTFFFHTEARKIFMHALRLFQLKYKSKELTISGHERVSVWHVAGQIPVWLITRVSLRFLCNFTWIECSSLLPVLCYCVLLLCIADQFQSVTL